MSADHEVRSHALLGGSSADRWVNCTGSVFLTKDLPPQAETEATAKGTLKHEYSEVLIEHLVAEKTESTDPLRPLPASHPEWQDEIEEDAIQAREVFWEKIVEESLEGKEYGQELKFVISKEMDISGYADAWAYDPDRKGKKVATIGDWKFGRTETSMTQLIFYGVGLYKKLQEEGKDIDYLRGIIFQPHGRGEKIKEIKVSKKALLVWEKKFIDAGYTIYVKKQAKFKLGSWCQWCRGQTKCKLYQAELTKQSQISLMDASELVLPEVAEVPEANIVKIAQYGEQLKKFIAACKKHVYEKLANGESIPGVKLVHTKTRRTWVEDKESIIDVVSDLGVEIESKKLRALTHVEKDLKKAVGKEEASEIMEKFTEQTTPSLIVVGADDPREPVSITDSRTLLAGDEDFD